MKYSLLLNRFIIVILYKKFKIRKMNLICTYELLQKGACCLTKENIEEILNIFLYRIFLSTVPIYFVNYSRKLSLCWQCCLGERCGTYAFCMVTTMQTKRLVDTQLPFRKHKTACFVLC